MLDLSGDPIGAAVAVPERIVALAASGSRYVVATSMYESGGYHLFVRMLSHGVLSERIDADVAARVTP